MPKDTKAETGKSHIWFGRSVLFIWISDALVSLQGLILFPILARKLGTLAYGIWSLILATVSLGSLLAMMGLGSAMIRHLAVEKGKEGLREGFFSIFSTVLLSSLILASFLFLGAKPFTLGIVKDASAIPIVQIAIIAIILESLVQVALAFFTTTRQMKELAGFRVGKAICDVVFIGGAVFRGYGLLGAVIAMLISRVLILLIILPIIISQIGFKFPRFIAIKSYLVFGLPLILVGAFHWIVQSSDRYLVGYFLDPTSVGIYSAAYALGLIVSMFASPIGLVLYPTVSKAYDEGDKTGVRNYLENATKYYLLFAIPAAFGLSILSAHILLILGTAEFVPGKIIVPFIAFGMIFWKLFSLIAERILALVKKTAVIAASLGAAAVVNVALNLLLIPRLGILGAAIATLIACIWLITAVIFASVRYLKVDFNLVFIVKSLVASTIMAFVVRILPQEGWASLLISIVVGSVIYFVIMFLSKGFTSKELNYLKEVMLPRHQKG